MKCNEFGSSRRVGVDQAIHIAEACRKIYMNKIQFNGMCEGDRDLEEAIKEATGRWIRGENNLRLIRSALVGDIA